MPWVNHPHDPTAPRRYVTSDQPGVVIDRHPDHRPSSARYLVTEHPSVGYLEVPHCGVLVLTEQGVRLFTTEQIQFEDAPLNALRED